MPNWCENTLDISGDKQSLNKFLDKLRGHYPDDWEQDPGLTFEALVPMPEEQKGNWYDWRLENWGTKWDIDPAENYQEESLEGGVVVEDEGSLSYSFDTAWGPPAELVRTLSEDFPTLSFSLHFHEPGMGFAGYIDLCKDTNTLEEGSYNHQNTDIEPYRRFVVEYFGYDPMQDDEDYGDLLFTDPFGEDEDDEDLSFENAGEGYQP